MKLVGLAWNVLYKGISLCPTGIERGHYQCLCKIIVVHARKLNVNITNVFLEKHVFLYLKFVAVTLLA